MIINIEYDFSLNRIADLLCSAMEGGSNYWYNIAEFVVPPKVDFDSFKDDSVLGGPDVYRHIHYPLSEGGAILFSVDEDDGVEFKTNRLDLNSIEDGLKIMSSKYPRHFSDFIRENDDAITGDVFLQCCLFGEIIYG